MMSSVDTNEVPQGQGPLHGTTLGSTVSSGCVGSRYTKGRVQHARRPSDAQCAGKNTKEKTDCYDRK